MYKCMACGNIEKFIGFVEEKGNAYIYQSPKVKESSFDYSWIFHASDYSWQSSFKVMRCFNCNSDEISEV